MVQVSFPTISNIWNGPSLTISVRMGRIIRGLGFKMFGYDPVTMRLYKGRHEHLFQWWLNRTAIILLLCHFQRSLSGPFISAVCAENNCSNFGYSLAETDVRQPEFTTFTIIMSILIIIAGLIIGLWSIRRNYKGHVEVFDSESKQ